MTTTQDTTIPVLERLEAAAEQLHTSGLLGLPTETVYGLAANALDAQAVQHIFKLKERPETHPLIVHVSDTPEQWHALSPLRHPALDALAAACWPGPLTLILPKGVSVPASVTGGLETVGVRVPQHPLTLQLLRQTGLMLAAPSANRFGRISPSRVEHVLDEFTGHPLIENGAISLAVLDGGPCRVGLESTILDAASLAETQTLRILRPGFYSREAIEAIVAPFGVRVEALSPQAKADEATVAAGTFSSHYAPQTPAQLLHVGDFEEALYGLPPGTALGVMAFFERPDSLPLEEVDWVQMPEDAATYAAALYATLRQLDAGPCAQILIEAPPKTPDWFAVLDRLSRATH